MTPRILLLVALVALLVRPGAAVAADSDPVGVWPLVPRPEVVAGFDPPADPWGAGHRGVDLLGSVGARVRSALPGRVAWSGTLAGRGVVVVDHGPTRTTYEPVEGVVPVGTQVGAGDRIGLLQLGGSHCLPRACLHWGWLRGEAYLDPLRLVGAGPVRLLPLWRAGDASQVPTTTVGRAVRPRPVVRLPYARWRSPIADLVYARGCACW